MSTQTNELARFAPDYPISGTGTPADPLRPRGKKAPQKFRSCNDDELELLRVKRDCRATDTLLDLLNHHHNFNIPNPPVVENIAPKKKPIKRVWVSVPVDTPPEGTSLTDIRKAVCLHFELDHNEFLSDRRAQKIVYPRQIAFYLGKTMTQLSFPAIGRFYGGKDHTTVLHGVRKIEKLVREDWRVAYDIAAVEAYL